MSSSVPNSLVKERGRQLVELFLTECPLVSKLQNLIETTVHCLAFGYVLLTMVEAFNAAS
jgi:hypothetical protein